MEWVQFVIYRSLVLDNNNFIRKDHDGMIKKKKNDQENTWCEKNIQIKLPLN